MSSHRHRRHRRSWLRWVLVAAAALLGATRGPRYVARFVIAHDPPSPYYVEAVQNFSQMVRARTHGDAKVTEAVRQQPAAGLAVAFASTGEATAEVELRFLSCLKIATHERSSLVGDRQNGDMDGRQENGNDRREQFQLGLLSTRIEFCIFRSFACSFSRGSRI